MDTIQRAQIPGKFSPDFPGICARMVEHKSRPIRASPLGSLVCEIDTSFRTGRR